MSRSIPTEASVTKEDLETLLDNDNYQEIVCTEDWEFDIIDRLESELGEPYVWVGSIDDLWDDQWIMRKGLLTELLDEVENMHPALKATDPREWVRTLK